MVSSTHLNTFCSRIAPQLLSTVLQDLLGEVPAPALTVRPQQSVVPTSLQGTPLRGHAHGRVGAEAGAVPDDHPVVMATREPSLGPYGVRRLRHGPPVQGEAVGLYLYVIGAVLVAPGVKVGQVLGPGLQVLH